MATLEKKLIEMARNAKRSRIPLEVLTRGAKPWAAKILEDEYNRFKPRKFTDKLTTGDEPELSPEAVAQAEVASVLEVEELRRERDELQEQLGQALEVLEAIRTSITRAKSPREALEKIVFNLLLEGGES
jgi:hypothetical protein